jgi:hypothetical protein
MARRPREANWIPGMSRTNLPIHATGSRRAAIKGHAPCTVAHLKPDILEPYLNLMRGTESDRHGPVRCLLSMVWAAESQPRAVCSQNRIRTDPALTNVPRLPVGILGLALFRHFIRTGGSPTPDGDRRSHSAADSASCSIGCDLHFGSKKCLRLGRLVPGVAMVQITQSRHRQHLPIHARPLLRHASARRVLLQRAV